MRRFSSRQERAGNRYTCNIHIHMRKFVCLGKKGAFNKTLEIGHEIQNQILKTDTLFFKQERVPNTISTRQFFCLGKKGAFNKALERLVEQGGGNKSNLTCQVSIIKIMMINRIMMAMFMNIMMNKREQE